MSDLEKVNYENRFIKVFLWKMNESEPIDEVSKITQQGERKFNYEYSWIGVVDNQCLGGIERRMFMEMNKSDTDFSK